MAVIWDRGNNRPGKPPDSRADAEHRPSRALPPAQDRARRASDVSENQMIDPGRSGDEGDAALDAALAAADKDLLAAISNGFDLDIGLARVLKDLGGSSASAPASRHRSVLGKTGGDRAPPFPRIRFPRFAPRVRVLLRRSMERA